MKNINNWKFIKWVYWIKNSPSDIPTDVWHYINLEIYPEDIEIMLTIFMPTTFEHRGVILLNIEGLHENEISDMFDKCLPNMRNMTEAQDSYFSKFGYLNHSVLIKKLVVVQKVG